MVRHMIVAIMVFVFHYALLIAAAWCALSALLVAAMCRWSRR